MRRFSYIGVLILAFAIISCTNYQYVQFESNLERAPGHDRFHYFDEGLYIDFNFWSNNGSTNIYIRNEGEEDIYFDLEKTLFIKNGGILKNGLTETFIRADGSVNGNNSNQLRIPPGRYLSISYVVFPFPYNRTWKSRGIREKFELGGVTYVSKIYRFTDSDHHDLEALLHFYVDAEEPYTREIRAAFRPSYAVFNTLSPTYFKGGGPTATYVEVVNGTPATVGTIILLGAAAAAAGYGAE